MAAIILLLLLMAPLVQASSDIHTPEEIMAMAEKENLPSASSMTFVDKRGLEHDVQWRRIQNPDTPTIYEYDGAQYLEVTPTSPMTYWGHIADGFALMHHYPDHTEMILSSPTAGNVFMTKNLNEPIQYAGEADFISHHSNHAHCTPTRSSLTPSSQLRGAAPSTCKKIYLSITADFDLYQQFGRSTSAVTQYVNSVISTVQMIYRREEIQIGISEIIIHTKEDGFRHWTALDDLNFFRFVRRSFNGDIALCLGGFKDQSGFAPLGGHAFLSSLCLRSTSYALVNVDGMHANYPNYSWDIFASAHELGHVLGSEHTHACVWGPGKNRPIDNCAEPEGGCSHGPSVSKGTIMSYCHLPGGPGVSFAQGFGPEPGNLIRQNIANASCLSDYIPTKDLSKQPRTITANMECHDGQYTHYYFDNNTSNENDDILVLSMDKKGQDIGHVYDGSLVVQSSYTSQALSKKGKWITAPYVNPGQKFAVTQKYWKVTPSRTPTRNVSIKLSLQSSDVDDLDRTVIQPVTADQLKVVTMSAPADANPMTNHRNATTSRTQQLSQGFRPSSLQFTHRKSGNQHFFEFETTRLEGLSIGVYEDAALPAEADHFTASREEENVQINWSSLAESNVSHYTPERSWDGKIYQPLADLQATGSNSDYGYLDLENQGQGAFYRVRITDHSGENDLLQPIYVEQMDDKNILPGLDDHVIRNQTTNIYIPEKWINASLSLTDINGRTILAWSPTHVGWNSKQLSTLSTGMYFLRIVGPDVVTFKLFRL